MKNKRDLFKIACAVLFLWVGVAGKLGTRDKEKLLESAYSIDAFTLATSATRL